MKLTKKHMEAAQMIADGDKNMTLIASDLGVTRQTLYNWLKTEEFKEQVEEYQKEIDDVVKRRLRSLTTNAVEELAALIHAESETVRLNAVKDILDRLGHKAPDERKLDVSGELKGEMEIIVDLIDEESDD